MNRTDFVMPLTTGFKVQFGNTVGLCSPRELLKRSNWSLFYLFYPDTFVRRHLTHRTISPRLCLSRNRILSIGY